MSDEGLTLAGDPQESAPRCCEACGAEVGDAKFCPECGTPVPETHVACRECGHRPETSPKFCPECGAEMPSNC